MAAERRLLVAAWIVVIVLLTGPWTSLTRHSHWSRVSWVPLATGIVRWYDVAGNVALYAPLGLLLTRQRPGHRLSRLWPAVTVALTLSVGLELSQVWSHTRFPSATDVFFNVAGAILGGSWQLRRPAEAGRPPES